MKKIIFLLLVFPFFVMAQNKLTVEKLWQMGRLSDPQISPDGKTLIYGVRTYDVKANKGNNIIYAINTGSGEPVALTDVKNNASAARFTPDGKKISYMSAESGDMQLWEMDLQGSNKTQITRFAGGIGGYKYSPKLSHIAYTADVKMDKEAKEIYPDLDKTNARIIDGLFYRHWDAWHDYAYSHLFIVGYANGVITGEPVDLMKGEKFDCPIPPHGDDDEFNWNADGTKIAYDCKKLTGTQDALSTNSDIYVYDLNTRLTQNISEANLGFDRNPQFSPDGSKLAWLSMATPGYESDRNTLVMHDFGAALPKNKAQQKEVTRSTNFPEMIKISADFDYPVESFKWAEDGKLIFAIVSEKGTKHLVGFWSDARGFATELLVGDFDVNEFCLQGKSTNALMFANTSSISHPNLLMKYQFTYSKKNLADKKLTTDLLYFNPNKALLSEIKMGAVKKRMVKTTDGKDMLVWVIYPPDFDPAKKYPTLLYCQGGPQSMVSQFFSYRWNFQLMAAHGYIVVAPNRRGLPGFGSAWNDDIMNDYGGQCMKDYLSAIDDVSTEPYVNKDKLGAVGASFGGYSVYWLAGNHNKRFKAFIAHCGMFNMESWYGSTEEMHFANRDNNGPYWSQTTSPNNFDSSPHKFVKKWDTPILVIHNEKDYRVPLTQGMEAFTAAQIQGIPSRFLYFPDENHWVVKPQNSILWQRIFFEWLDTYLK